MSGITAPLTEDAQGNPKLLPANAVKFLVKFYEEGKIGRPGTFYMDGRPLEFPITATWEDIGILPNGVYRFVPVDANGGRVAPTEFIEIRHLDEGPEPEDAQPANEESAAYAQAMKLIAELKAANRELHESQQKAMETMRQAMEQTTKAQVDLTKHLANVIEAAARTVDASHGAGLSRAADEIREIWDSAPESANNLETVLSSPVVVGAAHALQKFIANAAEESAVAAAESEGGRRTESMASRAARIAAAANARPHAGT
jgi:hypothetical protein